MKNLHGCSLLYRCATLALVLTLTAVIAPPKLAAQIGTTGTFSGVVQDSSGAVVPGATIVATHISTGSSHSGATDAQGRYQIPSLPLGDYQLEATHAGFRSQIRTEMTLTVGKNQEVNFQLEVGEVTESVTVQGAAPLIETRNAAVSSLVSAKEVSELPLNGRSFDQLIALSTGTALYSQRNVNAFRGYNNLYSVGGSRPIDTKLMVDGSEFQGGGGVTTNLNTASGKMLGVDGIQEFVVVNNNADASYGKKLGGQVTMVTRSGTNDFHGSVFEFIRNNIFDARNFFDPAVPPLKRNNYGAAAGGPIQKNGTFFFTNYEHLQENRGSTAILTVPDLNARNGILPGGRVLTVNPGTLNILNFYPVPNTGRSFGDGTAEARVPVSLHIGDTFGVARVDHRISDSDSLFGRYMIQSGRREDGTAGAGTFEDTTDTRVQLATLGYTRIFSPQLLNTATFAFNRGFTFIDSIPLPGVTVPPEMILVPGETKAGAVSVGATINTNPIPTLGGGTAGVQERFIARNLFQFADQVNYTHGPHTLQLGSGLQFIQSNEFNGTQKRGFLTFPSLEALITGVGQGIQIRGPLPGSDGFRSFRQKFLELYGQDSFRLTSTFTLNAGLRWELMTNPSEKYGRMALWAPAGNQLNGAFPDKPTASKNFFTENHSGNFAPRVGFAWDVGGKGRTAVRSGFGVFYSQIENDFRGQQSGNAPFWNQIRVNNPPFPNPGQALVTSGIPVPVGAYQYPDIPTQLQYNLRVEQTIASETTLALAYAGSHAYHLVRSANPQKPEPFVNAQGRLQVPQFIVNPRLDPAGTFLVWDANGFYNSLQMELSKRLTHGLRFKGAFTWSKSIDDSVTPSLQPAGSSPAATVATDHRYNRGLAPHNLGRQFVGNWSYDLPFGSGSGVRKYALNGWQLGGILTASDGSPFSALVGFSRSFPFVSGGSQAGDRTDLAPGRSNNPILGGPNKYFDPTSFLLQPPAILGNVGEDTLIGPGLFSMDLSLSKNTRITERFGLLFRAEFFNSLNRANFALPNSNIFLSSGAYSGSAGRIQSTATNSREIQFGLKLVF